MSSFGGFGGFGQGANTSQNTGFGGFGGNNNNNAGGLGTASSGAFGANPSNTNTAGGLFGGTGGFGTGAGGFGPNTTANTNNNVGFNANKPAFGTPANTTNTGMFGTNNASTTTSSGFGGFGASTSSNNNSNSNNAFGGGAGLFGAGKPATGFGSGGGGLFGSGNANNPPNSSAFGTNTGGAFGGALNNPGIGSNVGDPPGTSVVPFQAYTEKEANGTTTNAFQNVAFQDAYKKWSQEELRLADYSQGRQHGNASGAGAFGVGSGFGSGGFGANTNQTNQTSGFGSGTNATGNPLFGSTNNTSSGFGQPNTGAAFGAAPSANLFGNKPAATGFGSSTTTTQPSAVGGLFGNSGGGGFGSNAGIGGNTNTFGGAGGLFGNPGNQNKTTFGSFNNNGTTNAAPSPFGAANSATNNAFGANTAPQNTNSSGNTLFGTNPNNNTLQPGTGGIFGGTQQNSTSSFGTGGGFGAQTQQQQQQQQNTGNSLFPNNAQKPGGGLFGSTTSGTTGGIFGNPNTTNPSGFNANASNQPAAGGLFGPKPTATGTSVFGNSLTTQPAGGGAGGLFGNVPAGNNQGQPQALGAVGMFGSTLGQSQQQKPSMFGISTQPSGAGLFGSSAQQPSNSLFGTANNQPQQTVLGGSLLGASASQFAPSPTPQGLTTSLTDLSAYSSSLFANMGGAVSSNPGPVATPLSKSTARRSSVLPMYKLNPSSASRMVTPQKRGFGLSSYGTPASSATAIATTPGSHSRSLLGSGVGRGLSKSVSANTLRRTLNAEDSILAPGAFSASAASRLYGGSTGSGKKLIINRDMRSDLFSSPNKDKVVDSGSFQKLTKRVSFETDEESRSIVLIENGSVSKEATPVNANGNALATITPEFSEPDRAKELAAVQEEDGEAGASSKTVVVDPSLEVGPWELSPSWDHISKMTPTQRATVPNFRISRQNAATITFKHPVDLTGLTLEDLCGKIVKLKPREASVYPAGTKKPPRGQGLNIPAQLIIYQAWPRHPDNRGLDDASVKEHVRKLARVANTKFESYDKNNGVWTFSVPHFTTYGVDSGSDATDDEGENDDDIAIEAHAGSFSSPAPRRYNKLASGESHVPGAFEAGVGAGSRRQSFLGNSSVGSPSNEMRLLDDQYPSHMDDEYDMSENDDLTKHSSKQHHATEQDDFSSDGEQEKAPGTTPGGILRARMRALKEAAGPVELQVADGDDWMEMLHKTVSPAKADRQVLRARQELFSGREELPNSVSLLTQSRGSNFVGRLHDVASPANMAGRRKEGGVEAGLGTVPDLGDGRGFSNSIDLMRSLFDDTRTSNLARNVSAMPATLPAHGFIKWPYERKERSIESDHVDDAEATFRSTIKPSWGPHGTIIYAQSHSPIAGVPTTSLPSQYRAGTSSKALVCTSQQDIRIGRLSSNVNQTSTALLRHQIRLSTITTISQPCGTGGERYTETIPSIKLQTSALQEMTQLVDANSPSGTHERLVWELAGILFDSTDDTSHRLARKARLSQFWKSLVQRSSATAAALALSSEEKALACLSGHMIPEACKHLLEGRNFHLATLVSLIGTSERSKKDMREQLVAWRQSKMLSEFSLPTRALYELLGGCVGHCEGTQNVPKEDRVEAFVMSERFGLDWKRAFGMRLWYGIGNDDDISAAVAKFNADISAGYEKLPPPWYRKQGIQPLWEDTGADLRQDLLWGLLQVQADPQVDIESVLRPENSQLSPLDCRLTWQLGVALVSTGKLDFGARGAEKMDTSTFSFASQLVSEGDWVSAVFVLLHLSDPARRVRAVQELLARQAGSIGPETGETFRALTVDLKIPATWIWEAQALFMRSVKGDHEAEVRYLVRAGAFIEAHRVLVDRVAPQAVVELDYATLNMLMVQFRGREASISDWSNGGEIYDAFLQFAEHHVRGGPIPVHILGKLLTGLPAMEARLGSGNSRDYVKHAAVACMADSVARAVLRHTKELEASGGDIRAKIQGLPLTSDRRLRYSMDQSWECFTSQVLS